MKNNLRKLLCILLACCLLLAACQSKDSDKSSDKDKTEVTNTEAPTLTPSDTGNEPGDDEGVTPPETGDENGDNEDETPTETIPSDINQIIVTTEKEKTGGELYDTLIVWPTVYMPQNPDAADKINKNEEFQKILSTARDVASTMPENGDPEYGVSVSYLLQPIAIYSTAGAISITFLENVYYGGAHPMHGQFTFIFNKETGDLLNLHELLADGASDAKKQLGNMLIEKFDNDYGEELYYSAEEVVDLAFSGSSDGYWSLTSDGLQISFSPYEVAAYAVGYVIETIPYSELSGILDEKYFPEVYKDFIADASPRVETAAEIAEHENEYGTLSGYAMVTSGTALEVNLCDAEDYGAGANPTNVVFYANYMTEKEYFWIEETDNNLFVVKYSNFDGEKLIDSEKVIDISNGD